MPIKRSNNPKWADVLSLFQQSIGSKFVIPVYQRNYVWEAKKQVKTLLDDYYALIGNNKTHFLGIIIDYLAEGNSTSHKYYVIDGQQRLTTLFLLIRALTQRAIEESNESVKAQLKACLNVNPWVDDKAYKLEPLMSDGDIFKKILNGEYNKLRDKEKSSNIAIAYSYIYNFVSNSVKNIQLQDLLDALGRLYLVEIPLDKDDNAQQIFESINFKGSPLMATDLIRNYILMCTEDDKKDEIFLNKWQPFEAKFANAGELEKFFRFFVMSQTREFVKRTDVYDCFREWVDEQLRVLPISDVIDYVDKYADSYSFLYKDQLALIKEEQVWKIIKDYRNIESEMPAPLMLEIVTLYLEGDIDKSQFIQVTNIVNSFILRRAIIGMDTSGISRFFTTVIKPIMYLCNADYSNIVDVVRYCIVDDNKGKASRMPDNGEIKAELETLNVYDNALALHCFFDKYENEKMTNPVLTMNYQIEHIMPQDGTKWLSVVGLTEDEYNSQTGRLGNLTLTTKHANPAMSNNLFDYKQAILKDTAGFRLNVGVYSLPNWNKDTIDDRNALLINELIRLYPYEGSVDKDVYDEQIVRNRSLPKMDKLIEWGIVNKGDALCLGRYKGSSKAILLDADNVSFDGETLKISQRISKIYGISTGLNSYREIYLVGGASSLDELRSVYMKEHPFEVVSTKEGGFRDSLASMIKKVLRDKEKAEHSIEVLTDQNTYIRFAGIKCRNKVGLKGDGSWDKIKDLIAYEVCNRIEDGVQLNLYIGPGDRELREKWLNFSINNGHFKPKYTKLKAKWNCIHSYKLADPRTEYDSDATYFKEVLDNLNVYFGNDFINLENEFENAPNDLDAEIYQYKKVETTESNYDENYHLSYTSNEIRELYKKLKEEAFNVSTDFETVATKVYLSFKYHGKNVFDIIFYKSKLKIVLNMKSGTLEDPDKKCRDISNIGSLGNGDYDINISTVDELPYLMSLVKETLNHIIEEFN